MKCLNMFHNAIELCKYKIVFHFFKFTGSYGKLCTEYFPSFYGPSSKSAGHKNKEGKNEDP